ncbi:DUF6538 domain-containing protein [Paraburkholderia sediminicola]|uniref:DUF6538 domain-containing protein n=1 Tax=Paraburkholderia sediminicola TaxID=458836 RepID=UPI0038B72F41
MRLPHHLVRHPSGIFHYRQKIPLELQAVTGRKVIKKSLRTRCPKTAQAWAYVLAARYDAVFHAVRSGEMTKPTVADLLAHVDPADTRPYELALPNGVSIKATDRARCPKGNA